MMICRQRLIEYIMFFNTDDMSSASHNISVGQRINSILTNNGRESYSLIL